MTAVATPDAARLVFAAVAGLILLLILIIKFKVHAMISILIGAVGIGLMAGMPLSDIIGSVNEGIGNTLKGIALLVGLGSMFGAILEESGGEEAGPETVAEDGREPVAEEVYDRELAKDADWEDYLGEFASTPRLSQSREDEAAEEISPLEARYAAKPTLEGHLLWQLRLSQLTDAQKAIGEVIIGNLSSSGYLQASVEEVAEMAHAAPDEVRAVLEKVQHFDPVGVAARDARECLLVQIRNLHQPSEEGKRLIVAEQSGNRL